MINVLLATIYSGVLFMTLVKLIIETVKWYNKPKSNKTNEFVYYSPESGSVMLRCTLESNPPQVYNMRHSGEAYHYIGEL